MMIAETLNLPWVLLKASDRIMKSVVLSELVVSLRRLTGHV